MDFGHEMLTIIEQIRKEIDYYGLNMRIGIHTVLYFHYFFQIKGTLIGGIIGTDVVRYDVYGADNMIANDMESNGKVLKIFCKYYRLAMLW